MRHNRKLLILITLKKKASMLFQYGRAFLKCLPIKISHISKTFQRNYLSIVSKDKILDLDSCKLVIFYLSCTQCVRFERVNVFVIGLYGVFLTNITWCIDLSMVKERQFKWFQILCKALLHFLRMIYYWYEMWIRNKKQHNVKTYNTN